MKSILFLNLFLTLGIVSKAQNKPDTTEGASNKKEGLDQLIEDLLEGGVMKEEWTKITTVLCDPLKVDDSMITAMNECLPKKGGKLGKYLITQLTNKIYDKCGKQNEGDVIEFTKVTNADNKKQLMLRCSKKTKTCLKDELKAKSDKLRDSFRKVKPKSKEVNDKDVKFQFNGQKMKKKLSDKVKNLTTCLRKAVKLE